MTQEVALERLLEPDFDFQTCTGRKLFTESKNPIIAMYWKLIFTSLVKIRQKNKKIAHIVFVFDFTTQIG